MVFRPRGFDCRKVGVRTLVEVSFGDVFFRNGNEHLAGNCFSKAICKSRPLNSEKAVGLQIEGWKTQVEC